MQLRVDVRQTSSGATPIDADHFEFLLPEHQGWETLSERCDVEAENTVGAEPCTAACLATCGVGQGSFGLARPTSV